MKILALNPGSTSTKIAVFHAEKSLFGTTVRHPDDKINSFKRVAIPGGRDNGDAGGNGGPGPWGTEGSAG